MKHYTELKPMHSATQRRLIRTRQKSNRRINTAEVLFHLWSNLQVAASEYRVI